MDKFAKELQNNNAFQSRYLEKYLCAGFFHNKHKLSIIRCTLIYTENYGLIHLVARSSCCTCDACNVLFQLSQYTTYTVNCTYLTYLMTYSYSYILQWMYNSDVFTTFSGCIPMISPQKSYPRHSFKQKLLFMFQILGFEFNQ